MNLPNLRKSALLAAFSCAPLSVASAQMSFSIDWHGPSRGAPDCGLGVPMSDADILAPCGAAPVLPIVPGPLPPPFVVVPGGVGGLGIPTVPGCVGAPGGALCPSEVDALSYGFDGPAPPGPTRPANWYFSVDEYAVGFPGVPYPPSVDTENGPGMFGDASADVFVDNGMPMPAPIPPGGAAPGNTGLVDGNGRLSLPSNYAYKGLGLIEPNPPTFAPPPDFGDNLDAVDMDTLAVGAPVFPVYYSLDSAFPDPRNGAPNSGTALAQGIFGLTGGAVLVTAAPGGPPAIFAPAPALGLDLFGFDTDDLDALCLFENGSGFFEPSMVPYDWMTGATDMLLFSVREGSAIIGTPDSILGIPIQAGDILTTPAGGVGPPGIFIACENLGLMPGPTRGGGLPWGDDLDALDFWTQKELLVSEYCYGDGGALPGCRPCACGNNAPPGSQTGCLNSSGTGTRLVASGLACASMDTLRFDISGAPVGSVAILQAGMTRLPMMGMCPPGTGVTPITVMDGLRCIGGSTIRYGLRPVIAPGVNATPWGAGGGPPGGLIANGGFAVGAVVQWQSTHRDFPTVNCMTGLNTSNAVQVIITP